MVYELDGPGIESRWGRDFPQSSRPAIGPTQPRIQWEPGFSRGVKRPGRGFDHPPHVEPRLKKEWSYTSTPSLDLRGLFLGELYLYLYLLPLWRKYQACCLGGRTGQVQGRATVPN